MDISELVHSGRFLSGGSVEKERRFVCEGKRPWVRRVVSAQSYLDSLSRRRGERSNEVTRLEEDCQHLNTAFSVLEHSGIGSLISELPERWRKIESLILNHPRIAQLADEMTAVTRSQTDSLIVGHFYYSGPTYAHLRLVFLATSFCPQLTFRLVDALWDAYTSGLVPFGMFDWSLDDNYTGEDVLLCLNPMEL